MCWAAWARGRTVRRSILTWDGRVATHADDVGDVVGGERLGDTGVHGVGLGLVAIEAGQGEPFAADHPGRDLTHPHRLVEQLQAERVDDGLGCVFRGGVPAATLVGDLTGRRAHHDDLFRSRR